jgi:hypothetical protein
MKRKNTLFISVLVLLLIPYSIYGERNISRTSAESGYPAVAVNQEGTILVVWPEGGHEAGTLYYSVFKDGNWSSPADTKLTRHLIWFPQLDVDSEGKFHLTYADGRSRLNREIYHAVYDPDEGWSSATMIWDSQENSAWSRISIDNDRVFILWHHENSGKYLGHDIVMQSKMKDEDFWPTAYERISWTADDNSTHPDFEVRDDIVSACYMEGIGDAGPWRIFFKQGRRGAAWNNVQEEQVTGLGYRPSLAVDTEGGVHIVWATKDGNYYYRSKENGQWRGTQVISDRYSPQQFGDLRHRSKVLVATWAQKDASGQSAYYAKKNVGGSWDTPVQITQGSSALYPRVWLDGNGYAHFVWQDHGNIFYEKVAAPPPDPFLQLSTQSLAFVVEGANPDPTTFTVKNIGERVLNYTAGVDQDWLSVTPTSGSLQKEEEDELQVVVDAVEMDEGTYTGHIEISSSEAINSPQSLTVTLEVLAPPIYPPLNFSGLVMENKALFYREYMHKLTWEPNPQNRDITSYRIYEIDGVNTIFLTELPASTLQYTRRHIDKTKEYTYELWAVDEKGRTGDEPATLTLNAATSAVNRDRSSRGTRIIKTHFIN